MFALDKRLLLLDGLGALLTTLILTFVLAPNESIFGMPKGVLYGLSIVGGLFAIYSISSYFLNSPRWRQLLKVVAIGNILYCILSIGLVLYFFKQLTLLGVLYFFIEVIIIITLVFIEIKATNGNSR